MTGERRLPVDRAGAWKALNDLEVIVACIPGGESMEKTGENEYAVVIASSLGPVRARFNGRLTVTDIVAPESYSLHFQGQGAAAGFARGTARVRLEDDGECTLLKYAIDAQVGGKLAQVGSRLIDSAALKLADDFFAAFEQRLATGGTT
jgi:carbon monoxide dehydrogenase subunit G